MIDYFLRRRKGKEKKTLDDSIHLHCSQNDDLRTLNMLTGHIKCRASMYSIFDQSQ